MKQYIHITAVLFSIFTGTGFAQQFDHRKNKYGEAIEQIETIKMWKLTEKLDLNEEQTAIVFPAMKAHRQKMDSLETQGRKLIEELRQALFDNNEKKISQLVEQALTLREAKCLSEIELMEKLRTVLSPKQQAEFLIFEIEFRESMIKFLQENRELFKHKKR